MLWPGCASAAEEDEGQWGLRDGGCTALRLHTQHDDRMLSAGGDKFGDGVTIVDWLIVPADPPAKGSAQVGKKAKVHCPIRLLKQRTVRMAPDGPLSAPAPMIIGAPSLLPISSLPSLADPGGTW